MAELTGADEFAHVPGEGSWQENYAFYGGNAALTEGLSLHLQHVARDGTLDVRAGVTVGGVSTTTTTHSSGEDCFASPGLTVEVVEPFRRWRLRYEGRGFVGPDADGWYFTQDGDVPFGFDVELTTRHHPVFVSELAAKLFADDPGAREMGIWFVANHYQAGAEWTGRLFSGDTVTEASGLLVRDHTWGPRDIRIDDIFWTPMVFDGARRFVASSCALYDGVWRSYFIEADETGIVHVLPDYRVRTNAVASRPAFTAADSIAVGDGVVRRFTHPRGVHVPAGRKKTFQGSTRGLVNFLAEVHSDASVGFGTVQYVPIRP
ncbi:hypothetical protein ABT352_32315 [Streptosporangium sp. NPDC000563]|uniref:hypothetical protein n=1 Tax=unclassified Streptosporangium TaxID=2632669 RepID=UPI00331993D0